MKLIAKQISTTLVILSFLLGGVLLAHAQQPEVTSASNDRLPAVERMQEKRLEQQQKIEAARAELQERRAEREAKMEEKREEMKERMEERKAKLDEKRQERILNYTNRIETRMTNAIVRLNRIADKVLSRYEKIEEVQGINLEPAKDVVAQAKIDLEAAQDAVDLIVPAVEDSLSEENPKAAFETAKELMHSARDLIKYAHATLRSSVQEAKAVITTKNEDDSGDEASDNDGSDDSNDDSTSATVSEIEGDVFTDTTLVKLEFDNGDKELFETSLTERSEIVTAISTEYDISEEDVDSLLVLEVEDRESTDDDRTL